jgi:hypothetical protein
MTATRIFTPLVRRRSVPLPTWRGWLLVVTLFAFTVCLVPPALYNMLATTDATGGGVLIIEGWIQDQSVEEGIALYRSGRYDRIVTTGVPIDYGSYLSVYGSSAEVARATCLRLGIDSSSVAAAAVHGHIVRDRTLASAYALRAWLRRVAPNTRQVDILSQGVHAQRTHMIFARVLGDSVRVGIIAARETRYGANDWWKSSAGVKDVGGEVVGYIYAAIGRDQPPPEE